MFYDFLIHFSTTPPCCTALTFEPSLAGGEGTACPQQKLSSSEENLGDAQLHIDHIIGLIINLLLYVRSSKSKVL